MKRKKYYIVLVILLTVAVLPLSAVKREHRAVWMTGYLDGEWPTGAITEQNADAQKNYCLQYLDSLQHANFTTVYFHVRTMCDAMYDSEYEPWSSYISAARGVEPAFDPLRYILDNAHERGIEIYAWLNPYRYLDSTLINSWGDEGGDKNYENSHPDWLITYNFINDKGKNETYTILNPALPEVKQRIVDVIADLLSKYDVDGVVFDDYFYQNGLPMSYDAEQYDAYEAGDGTLSQADWRRENVNDMVRMVNAYIKANKPWVRFGISPAGVAASNSNVAAKYGVDPCPGSDWQYDDIYSDPLAWLSEGTIDFISPQVYWSIGNASANYALITPWWYEVAKKFNRHCYISQTLSNYSFWSADEPINQIDLTRTSDYVGAPGYVLFRWYQLRTEVKNRVRLMSYLRYNAYQNRALSPAVTWMKAEPATVTGVARLGRTLTWKSAVDNVRYTVYAVPKSEMGSFHKEEQYLLGVSYSESFDIPDTNSKYPEQGIADSSLDDYIYAVCVFDRYGNEYSAVFEGADVTPAEAPVPVYPVAGEEAGPAFNFQWEGNAAVYELTIADDAGMENVLVKKEVTANYLASTDIWDFEADKPYYWTVTARGNNTLETVSAVNEFTVDVFRITSPAGGQTGCADNLAIEWTAIDGGKYNLEISENDSFAETVYSIETDNSTVTVPEYTLSGGFTYYARVSSSFGGSVLVSKPVEFTTAVIVPDVPFFINPKESGATMYSNWPVSVEPERGIRYCNVMICENTGFAPRSSYSATIGGFVFETPVLGDVKIVSEELVDGITYYVRARFSYIDENGATAYTEWTEPLSFVYNAEAGVGDAVVSGEIHLTGGGEPAVIADEQGVEVAVYSMDGKLQMTAVTDASGRASLASLESGAYMVVVRTSSTVKTFKLLR